MDIPMHCSFILVARITSRFRWSWMSRDCFNRRMNTVRKNSNSSCFWPFQWCASRQQFSAVMSIDYYQDSVLTTPTSVWPISVKLGHDMEGISTLMALCDGNPIVTAGFPLSKTTRQECIALMISLMPASVSCWINNTVFGDMKRYDAHVSL